MIRIRPLRAPCAAICVGLLIASGCGGDAPAPAPGGVDPATSRCLVVTTAEFGAAGGLTVVDADSLAVRRDVTAAFHDALVRVIGEDVYVINRHGADSIQRLNVAEGYATAWERSVGHLSNPWDLISADQHAAWVPLYNDGELVRVDLQAHGIDGFVLEHVDVPPSEGDERADLSGGFVWNDVVYVFEQGLDAYPSCTQTSRGRLLAFDAATMAPAPVFDGAATLTLAACNPGDWALGQDGTLYVALTGNVRSLAAANGIDVRDDGGVEQIDLTNGRSLGLVLTEAGAGDRDVMYITTDEHGSVWLALADDAFSMDVVPLVFPFDGPQAELGQALWSGGGLFDLEARWGRLYIADRTRERPGVVVFDVGADGAATLVATIDTGLPPHDIAFLERAAGCLPL